MRKEHKTILTLVISLCLMWFSAGCDIQIGGSAQAKYERTVERQTPLAADSKFEVTTSFGSITITGADVADCSVVAKISGMAPTEEDAQELAEQVEIVLEKVGDTLTVKAEKPHTEGRRSVGISYDITVPRQTNVKCSSSYGSVKLIDIKGIVNGRTSSGSITAENIEGPTDLDTSYGSITCRNISEGDIKLKTSSGSIKLYEASFGNCDVNTSYGSIQTDNLEGDSIVLHSGSGSIKMAGTVTDTANISTSYGRITCRQITTGEITAKSSSGGIDVVCSESTPSDLVASLVTSYGSIDFVGPPNYAGKVDVSTSYGSIRTELPITVSGEVSKKNLKGTVGQGDGNLYLHTSSGSINLKQNM